MPSPLDAIPGIGTAIGAGLGVLGGLFSFIGKNDQAAQLERENAEALRRRQAADAQRFGFAEAAVGSTGADFGSASLQTYLQSMKAEMQRQQQWMAQQGAANVGNLRDAAGFSLFTDLGGTLSQFAKQNNYWQKPLGG
jgi:hypothetical protein